MNIKENIKFADQILRLIVSLFIVLALYGGFVSYMMINSIEPGSFLITLFSVGMTGLFYYLTRYFVLENKI